MATSLKKSTKATKATKTTVVTKKTAAKPSSKAAAEKPLGTLAIPRLDTDSVAAAFAEERERSAGGQYTNYMKFAPGKNRIRLLPVPVDGKAVPFVAFKAHRLKMAAGDKYPRNVLDYGWLFNDDTARDKVLAAGKLTAADLALGDAHRDPATELAAAAKGAGLKTKQSMWAGRKGAFVVLDRADNTVKLYEASKAFMDFIIPLVTEQDGEPPEYPDLYDLEEGYDILVNATGDGLQRRYTYQVSPRRSAVELADDAVLPDVWATIVRYAVPYAQKVHATIRTEPEIAKALGFTAEKFGVSAAPEEEDEDFLGDAMDD